MSTDVRRRLRKPSKVSTSVSSTVSRSSDQVIAASVNRPKIRSRPILASRKSSAAIDNSVATEDHKDKDGYKVSIVFTLPDRYDYLRLSKESLISFRIIFISLVINEPISLLDQWAIQHIFFSNLLQ